MLKSGVKTMAVRFGATWKSTSMVPVSMPSIRPRASLLTLSLLPGQRRTCPPLYNFNVAGAAPAESCDPAVTTIPVPAVCTAEGAVGSAAKSSPSGACGHAGTLIRSSASQRHRKIVLGIAGSWALLRTQEVVFLDGHGDARISRALFNAQDLTLAAHADGLGQRDLFGKRHQKLHRGAVFKRRFDLDKRAARTHVAGLACQFAFRARAVFQLDGQIEREAPDAALLRLHLGLFHGKSFASDSGALDSSAIGG